MGVGSEFVCVSVGVCVMAALMSLGLTMLELHPVTGDVQVHETTMSHIFP